MINKKQDRMTFAKAIDAEKKTITAYVSTYEWDRMDERFAKGAWDLKNYLKNPVVLWAHDYKSAPIAKATQIVEDETGLLSVMEFAPDQRSQDIFKLYQGGFMSAFSVGFNPKDFKVEPIDTERRGVVFTSADLLEYSAVPVPANPGAIVGRDVADLIVKYAGPSSMIKLQENAEGNFIVNPLGPEEPETPPTDGADIDKQLKYLIDLAKTAKHGKLEKQQIVLLTNAVDMFQEIISEHQEGVPVEIVNELGGVVKGYSQVIKNLFPSAEETVQRVMLQIEKALSSRGRAA